MGGPATGEHALALTAAARAEAARLEESAAERERLADEAEAKSRRRFRAALVTIACGVLLALGAAGLGVVLSIVATNRVNDRREADITALAEQLAEPVAVRVRDDGRAESIVIYRAELDTANRRLLAAGLPIVPVPEPGAPVAEVTRQSIRATVLADLGSADVIADALRRQFDGANTCPALNGPAAPPVPGGDLTVTVLPDEAPPADRDRPGAEGGGLGVDSPQPDDGDPRGRPPSQRPAPERTVPTPAPPRAPAPGPTRPPGGLLPDLPLIPRLPLLGG